MSRKAFVPEDGNDERRELARLLNEATRDARDERRALEKERREVTELREQLEADLATNLILLIDAKGAEVRKLLEGEMEKIREMFKQAGEAVREHEAQLLGYENAEELLKGFIEGVGSILTKKVEIVSADLARRIDTEIAKAVRQIKSARLG